MKTILKNNLRFIAGILSAIMIIMFIAPFSCMNNSIVRADGSTDKRNALFVSLRWAMIRNKDIIDAGGTAEFDLTPYEITWKDAKECIADFEYIYTDFYFAKPVFTVAAGSASEVKDDTQVLGIKLSSVFSLEEQNRLDAKIDEIISSIPAGASDFDKALFIHDYICTHSIYDPDIANDVYNNTSTVDHPKSYTAYGCLVEGMAVCAGYSKAYKMIMDQLGIPCVIAISDEMCHAWNLIELDGEWYHVDTTWDDPSNNIPGFTSHKNFLKSDKGIVKASNTDHTGWISPVKSTSTIYDDAWFTATDSQIHLVNGDYIYSKKATLVVGNPSYYQYKIVDRTHDDVETDLLKFDVKNKFLNTTSFTGLIDGYLYYNTSNQIIRYSLANKTTTVMFENNDINILGFYPDEGAKTAKIKYANSENVRVIETVNLKEIPNSTGSSANAALSTQDIEIETKNYTLPSINDLYCFPEVEFADGSTALYFADEKPVVTPTPEPTKAPTAAPTKVPTVAPIATPTATTPTIKPTTKPSATTKPVPTESGVAGFTERLYTTCLGRDSEADGKAYWINELGKGLSGADVAKQFFFSKEFKDLKLDNKEYVTRLYKTLMDRNPEDEGLEFWVNELKNGKDRESVFDGFVNSKEWADICKKYDIEPITLDPVSAFAVRLYDTCLGRQADDEGVKFWTNEIKTNGASASEVARLFFFSPEFKDLKLDNKEYVTRLYKSLMNREPDNDGLTYWINQLQTSSSREDVFYGFSNSPEWNDICDSYGITK